MHLIGIGGAGMSGIARILLARGDAVSGSDAKESPRRAGAARAGRRGRRRARRRRTCPSAPATVVVSTAIRRDNPELAAARERGLPVVHRAAGAGRADRAGAGWPPSPAPHGKTSTTSMLTVALQHCGLDPSFAIGGDLASSGSGAHEGSGDIFVAEADESDASFLAFSPAVAVVTNVEADHLDHYGSAEAYVAAFDEFLGPDRARRRAGRPAPTTPAPRRSPPGPRSAGIAGAPLRPGRAGADARLLDFRPDGAGARIALRSGSAGVGAPCCGSPCPASTWRSTRWPRCWPGVELGAPPRGAAGRARRVRRGAAAVRVPRPRRRGARSTTTTPTTRRKVAAQLRAARDVVGGRAGVVVAFQPHLYSRTREFAAEFGAALGLADEVVVLDVYGAREDPEPGVSGALVADARAAAARAGALRAALGGGARGGGRASRAPAIS